MTEILEIINKDLKTSTTNLISMLKKNTNLMKRDMEDI